MATITQSTATGDTLADLIDRLGGIDAGRILLKPTPGTATEADVLAVRARDGRLCELIDGTLVEKAMGALESSYAFLLAYHLVDFLRRHDLGKGLTADGAVRLTPGLVRIPDVCFISWARFPEAGLGPIPDLAPDLAVEILSPGNTRAEMDLKLRDYFRAGVRLVWYVDPRRRTVRVHTSPTDSTPLQEDDLLDGGEVLPGFRLALRDWFDEGERTGPR